MAFDVNFLANVEIFFRKKYLTPTPMHHIHLSYGNNVLLKQYKLWFL